MRTNRSSFCHCRSSVSGQPVYRHQTQCCPANISMAKNHRPIEAGKNSDGAPRAAVRIERPLGQLRGNRRAPVGQGSLRGRRAWDQHGGPQDSPVGDDQDAPLFVQTVQRKGYRSIAQATQKEKVKGTQLLDRSRAEFGRNSVQLSACSASLSSSSHAFPELPRSGNRRNP